MSTDKRKALGRGLSALIPVAPSPAAGGVKRDYFVCAIEEVHPSGRNPRQTFDEAGMAELAESIREHGVIQPLVVRTRPAADGGGFTLIAGERRWRAAQKAGRKDVPVVVKEASPVEAFELALVENLQRRDLNPLEEAEAFRRLCDEHGYTQERLAERVGKDRTTIVNALRLLKLPPPVRAMLTDARLSPGHARALLGLDDAAKIEAAAEQVVKSGMSVRQAEALVKRARAAKPEIAPEPRKSASVRDLEARLERSLGVRVRLQDKGGNAGRLEIDYGNLDELDRVLDKLLRV